MSLATRKRTLLAKIETTYGVDPNPTGAANAMLVKNLNINPVQAELVSRDLIRPYYGNSEQLLAQKYVTLDFEIEMVGAGVVGLTPAYDCLLRSCGFARTAQTASVVITSSGSVATVTKTAHGYAVGDKVAISGANEAPYNGTQTIVTVPNANTFTYAVSGSPASPATGTPVITTGQKYAPVSGSFESLSMYYNVDGILHKLTGCYGTVEVSLAVKQIPSFKFNFTGIYNAPSDTVAPSVDYSGWMIPQVTNTQNTPAFSLMGFQGAMESMSLNLSNDVQYISRVGYESVQLLDRKPAGTFVIDAPTIAQKDFFTLVSNNTQGAMSLTQGSRNGYKVKLDAPSVLLGNPSYQDSNGVQMLSLPFTINPVAGNDELSILVS